MGRTQDLNAAIERARQTAKAKGGECLSTVYKNVVGKLQWRCKDGHEWNATFNAVVNCGTWCAACINGNKQGRPRAAWSTTVWKKRTKTGKKPAVAKSGVTDSDELIDMPLNREEQAAIDFVLNRTPDDTSRIQALDDDEQHELSKEENGFLRAHMPTRWRCTKGHEWEATFNAVRVHGFGCPECKALLPIPLHARPKHKSRTGPLGPRRTPDESLKLAQTVAESHGGECLSTEFTRVSDKLAWRCAEGHEWNVAFLSVVSNGSWCAKCADNRHAKFMKEKHHAKNT